MHRTENFTALQSHAVGDQMSGRYGGARRRWRDRRGGDTEVVTCGYGGSDLR